MTLSMYQNARLYFRFVSAVTVAYIVSMIVVGAATMNVNIKTVEPIEETMASEVTRVAEESAALIVSPDEKIEESAEIVSTSVEPEEEYVPETPREWLYFYCEEYGVDPYIAIAISRLETGNWTSEAFSQYNFGGLTGSNGLYSFDSMQAGAERFISLISWYFENGMTTIAEMAPVYCPTDPYSWAAQVNELMKEEMYNEYQSGS